MGGSLGSSLQSALIDFLSPLQDAADNPRAAIDLLASIGQSEATAANPSIQQVFGRAGTLIQSLKSLDADSLDSWTGIQSVLSIGAQASSLLAELKQLAGDPAFLQAIEGLAEDLLSLLFASYLRRRHQTLFRIAGLLTLVELRDFGPLDPAIRQNGTTLRFARARDQFRFSTLQNLISKPGATLKQAYLPNNLATALDAWAGAGQLFPYLGLLADGLNLGSNPSSQPVTAASGPDPSDDSLAYDHTGDTQSNEDASTLPPIVIPESFWSLSYPTFRLVLAGTGTGAEVGVALLASSLEHAGGVAGYVLTPFGTFNTTVSGDSWRLTISSSAQIPALVAGPSGVSMAPLSSPITNGTAKILVERIPPAGSTGPAFVFGSATGTHVEIGSFSCEVDLFFSPDRKAVLLSMDAKQAAFVIAAGDGDGFLSHILPASGMRCTFDLGMSLGSDSGFALRGSAGLDATLPIGISIANVLTIPSMHLALNAGGAGLQAEVSASAGLTLGPLELLVDRIGLNTTISFPDSGGNLGIADLALSFKPPSGVGLSLDAAGVSGGGTLGHDDAKKEYSGTLQLQFTDLALQAFGLITTQVAGSAGYSLFALVDAEFPPVQLGWGFTLNGVGGILALNRSASTDAIRASLKAGSLSSLLFPKNAITNAAQILGQLDALFPVAAGRFLFGPMALIGWGTPTLLTASLAVILELPEPVQIVLLAVVSVRLPSQDTALIRINMDALGVLDFSTDELSIDATLFDSRLLEFTLSGDMALRANWSDSQREFLLAIGGYHPQFTPPAGFPALQRITIDMPSGPVSKLRLAAYLAVSSNTVQFGATLDVFIGVSGFGISGHLGFDALLQLEPFHFDADISGQVALTAGGDDLMSVGLDATLSGPAPWHIAGSFKVHIVFFDVTKHFSYSWGDDSPAIPIAPVNVLPLLTAALADVRNWGSALPQGASAFVSLNNPGTPLVHPLALLEVHESVVPLGVAITRFGSAPVTGANSFTLANYQVNGSAVANEPVEDDFAPAQFFDLSDTDKLARPSFETHDAGLRLTGAGLVSCGTPVPKPIAYETFYIDHAGDTPRADAPTAPKTFPLSGLQFVLAIGASAKASIRLAGNLRYSAPGTPLTVAPQKFVVTDRNTLALAGIGSASGASYTNAQASLDAALSKNPAARATLQIVATHELPHA